MEWFGLWVSTLSVLWFVGLFLYFSICSWCWMLGTVKGLKCSFILWIFSFIFTHHMYEYAYYVWITLHWQFSTIISSFFFWCLTLLFSFGFFFFRFKLSTSKSKTMFYCLNGMPVFMQCNANNLPHSYQTHAPIVLLHIQMNSKIFFAAYLSINRQTLYYMNLYTIQT